MRLGSVENITQSHLRRLQFFYETDENIGKSIGISRQAVCIARRKFNIPVLKNAKYKRDKMIIDLHYQNFTGPEISRRVNVSVKTVYRVIKSIGSKYD